MLPNPRDVCANGVVLTVVVLVVLATIVARFAIHECLERGNWCDAIELSERE